MLTITYYYSKIVGFLHRQISSEFYPPLIPLYVRGTDSYGSGAFGACRSGCSRKHKGQDYLGQKGQVVFAPISGTVTESTAYASGKYPELRMLKNTRRKRYSKPNVCKPSFLNKKRRFCRGRTAYCNATKPTVKIPRHFRSFTSGGNCWGCEG